MKVVHINQTDVLGGAGIAAYRTHRGLRDNDVNSSLLVWEKASEDDSVIKLGSSLTESASSIAIRTIYIEENRTELSNTYFSLSLQGLELSEHPLVIEADIVHLHWVASLLTPRLVGRILRMGKPVFWTLHDVSAFTGGCHFPADCHEFEMACNTCSQLKEDKLQLPAAVLRDKKHLWDLNTLTLLCPSHWIREQARNSNLFRSHPRIEVLPYCINTKTFRKGRKAKAREQLNLNSSGPIIMVAAENGNEKRKGFPEVVDALLKCCRNSQFLAAKPTVVHVGRSQDCLSNLPIPVIDLGWVNTEEKLSLIFAACDLFVLPSLEDNLPNMAIEAACCGLPICGFEVGGMPDIVEKGKTGFLVAPRNTEQLAEKIMELTLNGEQRSIMSQTAADYARKEFGSSAVIPRLVEQYENALKSTNATKYSRGEAQNRTVCPGPNVSRLLPDMDQKCKDEAILKLSEEVKKYQQICEERQAIIQEQSAEIEMLRKECESRLKVIKNRRWWR